MRASADAVLGGEAVEHHVHESVERVDGHRLGVRHELRGGARRGVHGGELPRRHHAAKLLERRAPVALLDRGKGDGHTPEDVPVAVVGAELAVRMRLGVRLARRVELTGEILVRRHERRQAEVLLRREEAPQRGRDVLGAFPYAVGLLRRLDALAAHGPAIVRALQDFVSERTLPGLLQHVEPFAQERHDHVLAHVGLHLRDGAHGQDADRRRIACQIRLHLLEEQRQGLSADRELVAEPHGRDLLHSPGKLLRKRVVHEVGEVRGDVVLGNLRDDEDAYARLAHAGADGRLDQRSLPHGVFLAVFLGGEDPVRNMLHGRKDMPSR